MLTRREEDLRTQFDEAVLTRREEDLRTQFDEAVPTRREEDFRTQFDEAVLTRREVTLRTEDFNISFSIQDMAAFAMMEDLQGLEVEPGQIEPLEDCTQTAQPWKGGTIIVAKLADTQAPVSVKLLNPKASTVMAEELIHEAEMMSGLNHKHVLGLIGINFTAAPWFSIFEHTNDAPLSAYLSTRRQGNNPLASSELSTIASQVAEGMCYLHGKRTVHMNLATQNIQLTTEGDVKIAAFRVSQELPMGEATVVLGAPKFLLWRWMAPESMDKSTYCFATDVWAFGVVCWELFTCGMRPYEGTRGSEIYQALHGGMRLDKPAACSDHVYNTILRPCWEANPAHRPTFVEIRARITNHATPTDADAEDEYLETDGKAPATKYTKITLTTNTLVGAVSG